MITTTSLLRILKAKAYRSGHDDIFDKKANQIIRQGGDNALIIQLAKYTDFADTLVTSELFAGERLKVVEADKYFKKIFVNKFINREIKYQTLDLFRNQLISLYFSNEDYICYLYENYKNLMENKTTTNSNSTNNRTNNSRSAHSDLPQDNTGLDLNNDVVDYANYTDYSKTREKGDGTNDSVQTRPSVENLEKLNLLWSKKLEEFDKKLFLAIW